MNYSKNINIPLSEAKQVFEFLEKTHNLFHNPFYFQDKELVEKFAAENYKTIKKLYYDVVWKWLPENEQQYYEER